MRQYLRKIDFDEDYDMDLMSVEVWNNCVSSGHFCTLDGSGYWVKNDMASTDEVFSTDQLDATHVLWFSK